MKWRNGATILVQIRPGFEGEDVAGFVPRSVESPPSCTAGVMAAASTTL